MRIASLAHPRPKEPCFNISLSSRAAREIRPSVRPSKRESLPFSELAVRQFLENVQKEARRSKKSVPSRGRMFFSLNVTTLFHAQLILDSTFDGGRSHLAEMMRVTDKNQCHPGQKWLLAEYIKVGKKPSC